jgi:hypothetical protein
MSGFLDRLERDLVEAIDRREGAGARRRYPHPWRRPRWTSALGATAAIVAVVALVVLVRSGIHEKPAVVSPPAQNAQRHVAPIPPNTPLRLVGVVTRVDATTWRGAAQFRPRAGQRMGTLAITGQVDLAARPCCDTPRRHAPDVTHTVRFTWTTPGGTVGGCVANTVYRRPHGRFVWDGIGHITRATGVLARYQGRGVAIAGSTPVSAPNTATVNLASDNGGPGGGC